MKARYFLTNTRTKTIPFQDQQRQKTRPKSKPESSSKQKQIKKKVTAWLILIERNTMFKGTPCVRRNNLN